MPLFCAVLRRDYVSLLMFLFFSQVQIFTCKMLSVELSIILIIV